MTSATDNRTTELREKLDSLGIEHFDYDKGGRTQTIWETNLRNYCYETAAEPLKTAKLTITWFPTPEQAIAATLGSGTLTAEQIEKAIHDCSTYASYDGCTYYASGIRIQAIADELNAELGSGTCHMSFIDEYETASGDESYLCECSECGSQTWEPAHDLPLYCRKCGKAVKR